MGQLGRMRPRQQEPPDQLASQDLGFLGWESGPGWVGPGEGLASRADGPASQGPQDTISPTISQLGFVHRVD